MAMAFPLPALTVIVNVTLHRARYLGSGWLSPSARPSAAAPHVHAQVRDTSFHLNACAQDEVLPPVHMRQLYEVVGGPASATCRWVEFPQVSPLAALPHGNSPREVLSCPVFLAIMGTRPLPAFAQGD